MKETIEYLVKINDAAVVVDVLNVFLEKGQSLFTLDMFATLLPLLNDLLSAQYEE